MGYAAVLTWRMVLMGLRKRMVFVSYTHAACNTRD